MKRLIAVIGSLCWLFVLAACGGDKDNTHSTPLGQSSVDLAALMKQGKVPEAEFTIGTAVDTILNSHTDDEETVDDGHGHDEIMVEEGNRSCSISIDGVRYYYEKSKEESGVSSIVCQFNAYGFEVSEITGKSDVINAFPNMEYTEHIATNAEIYFLPFEMEDCVVITYSVDNFRLDFFFVDNSLLAVNLVDTNLWTLI